MSRTTSAGNGTRQSYPSTEPYIVVAWSVVDGES